jgi:sterol desaturase/sphingolipid hydroxylase (fatty acid hydroxylase superfamily)
MPIFVQYWFWLALVSLFCFMLERIRPWRRQGALRPQILQDLFWLIFNGHVLGLGLATVLGKLILWFNQQIGVLGFSAPDTVKLIGQSPPWVQFISFLVLKDLIEWCVHNLLHRVSWLWEFHKVHHTIVTLDWIGNMRFHWGEVLIYKSISYLPLVLLGVDGRVILWVAVFSTLIGHLNHSNLSISWGPFRYLLNSPRMHVWHHDVILRGEHGKNFGVVFSVWDWIFRTAYMPTTGQPERLGFEGQENFPTSLLGRLTYPLSRIKFFKLI